ncbi:hypothetical protein GGR54DRAFT_649237 [Hypoxylon sp. NC1633]|nr:hypothetical protein GGR54DRAFT_649237 [Hypoxylon sp. NC1633]
MADLPYEYVITNEVLRAFSDSQNPEDSEVTSQSGRPRIMLPLNTKASQPPPGVTACLPFAAPSSGAPPELSSKKRATTKAQKNRCKNKATSSRLPGISKVYGSSAEPAPQDGGRQQASVPPTFSFQSCLNKFPLDNTYLNRWPDAPSTFSLESCLNEFELDGPHFDQWPNTPSTSAPLNAVLADTPGAAGPYTLQPLIATPTSVQTTIFPESIYTAQDEEFSGPVGKFRNDALMHPLTPAQPTHPDHLAQLLGGDDVDYSSDTDYGYDTNHSEDGDAVIRALLLEEIHHMDQVRVNLETEAAIAARAAAEENEEINEEIRRDMRWPGDRTLHMAESFEELELPGCEYRASAVHVGTPSYNLRQSVFAVRTPKKCELQYRIAKDGSTIAQIWEGPSIWFGGIILNTFFEGMSERQAGRWIYQLLAQIPGRDDALMRWKHT